MAGAQKLYQTDPGFVDMAGLNFALKPDSAIFKDFPGFPDIPFSDIGPQMASGVTGSPTPTFTPTFVLDSGATRSAWLDLSGSSPPSAANPAAAATTTLQLNGKLLSAADGGEVVAGTAAVAVRWTCEIGCDESRVSTSTTLRSE